jgi:hypothetical protein
MERAREREERSYIVYMHKTTQVQQNGFAICNEAAAAAAALVECNFAVSQWRVNDEMPRHERWEI